MPIVWKSCNLILLEKSVNNAAPEIASDPIFLSAILFVVNDADMLKVTTRLMAFKSVWLDDTPGSIIKGSADIFVPYVYV